MISYLGWPVEPGALCGRAHDLRECLGPQCRSVTMCEQVRLRQGRRLVVAPNTPPRFRLGRRRPWPRGWVLNRTAWPLSWSTAEPAAGPAPARTPRRVHHAADLHPRSPPDRRRSGCDPGSVVFPETGPRTCPAAVTLLGVSSQNDPVLVALGKSEVSAGKSRRGGGRRDRLILRTGP